MRAYGPHRAVQLALNCSVCDEMWPSPDSVCVRACGPHRAVQLALNCSVCDGIWPSPSSSALTPNCSAVDRSRVSCAGVWEGTRDGPARERYEQALAIKEELGDRAGLASSLAQMGLLLEQEGQLGQSVGHLAAALALFEELGAPQRQQARRDLARLREKMGDEAFEAALQAAGGDNAGAAGQSGPASQGMTLEQAVQAAVANTVAVLTQVPERQEEWWGALGQLQDQVQAAGHADLAAFLGLLRQLVEGASPEHLDARVPPGSRPAWEATVRQLPPQGD